MYETATGKMQEYYDGEINHIAKKIDKNDYVLSLGCGYGREMRMLYEMGFQNVYGIDNNYIMLFYGHYEYLKDLPIKEYLFYGDICNMPFVPNRWDWVICIQNGLFVIGGNKLDVIRNAILMARKGVIFTTFDDTILEERKRHIEENNEYGQLVDILPDGTTMLDFRPPVEVYTEERFKRLFEHVCKRDEIKGVGLTIEHSNGAIYFILGEENGATSNNNRTTEQHEATRKEHD